MIGSTFFSACMIIIFSLHQNKEHFQDGTGQFFKMLGIVKIVNNPQQFFLTLEVQMLPDNTFWKMKH